MTLSMCTQLLWSTMARPVLSGTCPVKPLYGLGHCAAAQCQCPKPVVVAVHGVCVGAGVDLITACDIRLCTQDAWFQVKSMIAGALEIAGEIAGRSPVAVQGTKINLLYS
ncbi:delta(3,5)-Delta(2,4)-dienoyl-CoA isomerase, mitochondrial isoform X2 [Ictalurus punctatus]|nr:delta(3,5)-Delta(2,4)-dienoyl-CoA isomerase, mitochondrial isoform X2 [Ictalurus punctatus]XP_053534901.1 delta(3,5)-Delta(2,4)-dienoyl-CoA isomerase, mitochondrial isoform X2 [Ictalurus punctatus]